MTSDARARSHRMNHAVTYTVVVVCLFSGGGGGG